MITINKDIWYIKVLCNIHEFCLNLWPQIFPIIIDFLAEWQILPKLFLFYSRYQNCSIIFSLFFVKEIIHLTDGILIQVVMLYETDVFHVSEDGWNWTEVIVIYLTRKKRMYIFSMQSYHYIFSMQIISVRRTFFSFCFFILIPVFKSGW